MVKIRIVYLILAHRYPEQLLRLINRLDEDSVTFFIHLDKKMDKKMYMWLIDELKNKPNIHFLKRYTCYWAGYGIVKATMEGIKEVIRKKVSFDYLILLSGQDYPIKSKRFINDFLLKHKGYSFIHHNPFPYAEWKEEKGGWDRINIWHIRKWGYYFTFPTANLFKNNKVLSKIWVAITSNILQKRKFPKGFKPYGGTQFWGLYRTHAQYVNNFINENTSFVKFFRFVFVPDEILFQTIMGNSEYEEEIQNDTLTFVEWYRPGIVLNKSDFNSILNSHYLFARKFDSTIDSEILDMIDNKILR